MDIGEKIEAVKQVRLDLAMAIDDERVARKALMHKTLDLVLAVLPYLMGRDTNGRKCLKVAGLIMLPDATSIVCSGDLETGLDRDQTVDWLVNSRQDEQALCDIERALDAQLGGRAGNRAKAARKMAKKIRAIISLLES